MGLRVSYIGSTSRKLLNDVDFNTMPVSTVPFINDGNPDDAARLPYAPYGSYMDIVGNRAEGRYDSLQLELLRRWKGGFAVNAAYTLASSESNAPDTGNSTIGPVQFDPYNIEKDRGPDPNVMKPGWWPMPRGTSRWAVVASTAPTCRRGRMPSLAAGPSRRSSRPAADRTSRRSSAATTRPLRGTRASRSTAWAPRSAARGGRSDQGSEHRWIARGLLRPDGLCDPGRRQARECEEGKPERSRHLGRQLRLLQGRRRDSGGVPVQFSTILDNAFNHPQFFPAYGSGFVQLDDFLVNGDRQQRDNRSAGGRHHSQHGRILPRTRHTTGVTRDVLAGHRPCRASARYRSFGPPFRAPKSCSGLSPAFFNALRPVHGRIGPSGSSPRCGASWSKSGIGNR